MLQHLLRLQRRGDSNLELADCADQKFGIAAKECLVNTNGNHEQDQTGNQSQNTGSPEAPAVEHPQEPRSWWTIGEIHCHFDSDSLGLVPLDYSRALASLRAGLQQSGISLASPYYVSCWHGLSLPRLLIEFNPTRFCTP
jgi:hypothetical protein